MSRMRDTDRFYEIMMHLEKRVDGTRCLVNSIGAMDWPKQGVYFFFERGETRKTGELRVVRVGTHAVSQNSKTRLWDRLRTHRGTLSGKYRGGGNHRASVFRKLVGSAIIQREHLKCDNWDVGQSAKECVRKAEHYRSQSKQLHHTPTLSLDTCRGQSKPKQHSCRDWTKYHCLAKQLQQTWNHRPIDT